MPLYYTPLLGTDLADENAINAVLAAIEAAINAVPIVSSGTIVGYAGAILPDGWLLCDGSAISRTTYAALFAAIGTTWGSGDGGSTFNLPDMRGRIAIGAGAGGGLTARTLGQQLGEETHQLTVPELPSHDHTASGLQTINANNDGGASGLHYHPSNGGGVTSSKGGDGAHNNIQPSTTLNVIIKV
jgi:microcystin-dependent protein